MKNVATGKTVANRRNDHGEPTLAFCAANPPPSSVAPNIMNAGPRIQIPTTKAAESFKGVGSGVMVFTENPNEIRVVANMSSIKIGSKGECPPKNK